MTRGLLLVTLFTFGALTAVALWQHGYVFIIAQNFQNTAAAQVFADLVIALVLIAIWMWRDARASGRNPWPWLLITLVLGSFGPLLYLLARSATSERRSSNMVNNKLP